MKNTPISICLYVSSAHGVLRVCMTRKQAVSVCMRVVQTFECRPQSADDCSCIFIHGNMQLSRVSDKYICMNVSEGLSDAYASLSLLVHLFLCSKSGRNISSRSCQGALWTALRSHTSLFRHACMLILIRKHHMRVILNERRL